MSYKYPFCFEQIGSEWIPSRFFFVYNRMTV